MPCKWICTPCTHIFARHNVFPVRFFEIISHSFSASIGFSFKNASGILAARFKISSHLFLFGSPVASSQIWKNCSLLAMIQPCIVDHACCSLNFPYHGHRGKKQNDQDNSGYHHQYTQHIRLLLFFLLTHSFPLGNLLHFKSNARETWHAIPGSFADIYLTESRFQFPMRSTGTLICSILLNFNRFCNKKRHIAIHFMFCIGQYVFSCF